MEKFKNRKKNKNNMHFIDPRLRNHVMVSIFQISQKTETKEETRSKIENLMCWGY